MQESDVMPSVREMWRRRVMHLALRKGTKRYQHEAEAYMQGVLVVLLRIGAIDVARNNQIVFLVGVGRADELLDPEKKIKPPPRLGART